jgi:hypothetical protein
VTNLDKIKINSIILSEDSINDQNGKKIIIGPLPDIGFKVVPNNFSFNINFVLLNLVQEDPYNLEVSMIEASGKKIVDSKIGGLRFNSGPNTEFIPNSFISLGVKNQEFSSFGNCKVEISIEQENDQENKDKMSIVVPIVQRR